MKRLNPMDASWLFVESGKTPMHVALMAIFSFPEDTSDNFLHDLVAGFKSPKELTPPWNLKLRGGRIGFNLPAWKEDHDVDMDYHIRHSALPRPGGERELGVLVSRLHSRPLDFARPPWECHVIEGLEGNRFALYLKMHHSLIDGVSGARMVERTLSTDPDQRDMPPMWAVQQTRSTSRARNIVSPESALDSVTSGLKGQMRSTGDLLSALKRLLKSARSDSDKLVAPFTAPKSVLNKRVTRQRRFATQQYSMDRIKALAQAADCTLNDIVLAICGGSIRRYLKETNSLPHKPLTAGIPVNVRPADDQGTGNAISFIMSTLATDMADPRHRLDAIHESTAHAKDLLQSLPREAITNYTMVVMAPYILQLLTGLAGHVRPVFNITISNVPGPRQTLYYNGAKMEAMYPVSLITHGGALNITCQSYAGTLNFGWTGCRDTLPHMQRLATYTAEALDELEACYLPDKRQKRKRG